MTENKDKGPAKPPKKKDDVDALLNEVTGKTKVKTDKVEKPAVSATAAPRPEAPKAPAAPATPAAEEKKPMKAVFRVGGVSNKVAPGAIPTHHAKPPAAAPAPTPAKVAKPKPAQKPEPKKPEPEVVKQMITIRQVRSGICTPVDQKQALLGLGLRRIRHEVVRPDSRAIRGQVLKVRHLVEIVGSTPISK